MLHSSPKLVAAVPLTYNPVTRGLCAYLQVHLDKFTPTSGVRQAPLPTLANIAACTRMHSALDYNKDGLNPGALVENPLQPHHAELLTGKIETHRSAVAQTGACAA